MGDALHAPLPNPFVGKLTDKLSTDVKIKGKKVATKGSSAKHDSPVHMQLPGTIKFQNGPKEEGKVTGGTEKSVKANGKEVAVIGSSVTTCNDIGMRDNSRVVAVGMSINMPAIADPMKSEPYERERKQVEEKKEEEKNISGVSGDPNYKGTAAEQKRYNKHASKHFKHEEGYLANVKQGEPMTFEQADHNSVNPYYESFSNDGYVDVCVSCSYVFEARLRGWDVEVLPRFKGNKLDKLAHDSRLGWLNDKGFHPDYIHNLNANSTESMMKFVDDTVKEGERYTIEGSYITNPSQGHLISVFRKDGELVYYDGLEGAVYDEEDTIVYFDRMVKGNTETTCMNLLRVDNLQFDNSVTDFIMEEKQR